MNHKILLAIIAIINIAFTPLMAQDGNRYSLSKREESIAKGLMLSMEQKAAYFKLVAEGEKSLASLGKSLAVSERTKAIDKVRTTYYKDVKQLLNKEQYERFLALQQAMDNKIKKSLDAKSKQSQQKLNNSVRKTGK